MIVLTAGRFIPDSDGERVKAELDAFSRDAAPAILEELTRMVLKRKTGTIRVQIFVDDGRIGIAQIQPDYKVPIDGSRT